MDLARSKRKPLPAHSQAAYDGKTGIIHVFDQKTLPNGQREQTKNLEHSVRHEAGHAVDHYLDHESLTPEFTQAWPAPQNLIHVL